MTELETKIQELADELEAMSRANPGDSQRDRLVKAQAASTANRLRNILGTVASDEPGNLNTPPRNRWSARSARLLQDEVVLPEEDVPTDAEPQAAEE